MVFLLSPYASGKGSAFFLPCARGHAPWTAAFLCVSAQSSKEPFSSSTCAPDACQPILTYFLWVPVCIKKLPSQSNAGTRVNYLLRCHPAWCNILHPLNNILSYVWFVNGVSSPSRLLILSTRPQKPIPLCSLCCFPPPAALCDKDYIKYSLFFNGFCYLLYHSPPKMSMTKFIFW